MFKDFSGLFNALMALRGLEMMFEGDRDCVPSGGVTGRLVTCDDWRTGSGLNGQRPVVFQAARTTRFDRPCSLAS